jgi:alkaline phosphatase D
MALMSRRTFLSSTALVSVSLLTGVMRQRSVFAQGTGPTLVTPDSARPAIPYGVASGDVTSNTAIVWSRTNRPSRILVEYDTSDAFKHARLVQGPVALAVSDFTARVELSDLPAGQEIFYRVTFRDLADPTC